MSCHYTRFWMGSTVLSVRSLDGIRGRRTLLCASTRVLYALVRAGQTSACRGRVVSCPSRVRGSVCVVFVCPSADHDEEDCESTTDLKNEDIGREDAKAKSASPMETLFVRLPYPFGILSFSSILGRG